MTEFYQDPNFNVSQKPKIKALIEQGYAIFDRYPLDKETGVCECPLCFSDEDLLTEWQKGDVNNFSLGLINRYFASATNEEDELFNRQQMHALLPRVLDWFVQGYTLGIDNAYILRRCHFRPKNHSSDWTAQEIEFIQQFALIYFHTILCENVGVEEADYIESITNVLETFYLGEVNILPLLADWIANLHDDSAMLYLANLLDYDIEDGVFISFMAGDYPDYLQLMQNFIQENSDNFLLAFYDFKKRKIHPELSYHQHERIERVIEYLEQL